MRYGLAGSFVALACAACGARGPLSYELIDVPVGADGGALATGGNSSGSGTGSNGGGTSGTGTGSGTGSGTGTGTGTGTGSSGGGTTTTPTADGGSTITIPPINIPGVDSGLINCGACVATQCSSAITTCLADTTCGPELTCILQMCLAGGTGGGGTSCFTGCATGGISGLTSLLPIITCLTGSCGSSCGSVLGGLGGLGGLIRGEEVSEDVTASTPANAGEILFSAYPQLTGQKHETE